MSEMLCAFQSDSGMVFWASVRLVAKTLEQAGGCVHTQVKELVRAILMGEPVLAVQRKPSCQIERLVDSEPVSRGLACPGKVDRREISRRVRSLRSAGLLDIGVGSDQDPSSCSRAANPADADPQGFRGSEGRTRSCPNRREPWRP